jgi:V/A-type H+/Na+-transporting ATPase subunit G/H
MAKETVQAVRKAELNAAQLEKDSLLKRDAILREVEEEAKNLISLKTKEAILKAEADLEQAELAGKEIMNKAIVRANQEILMMEGLVKGKEQAAIDLVLKEIM